MSAPAAIVCPAIAQVDVERLAWAIRQVETGLWTRPGKHGERSAYQFTEAVWREETELPWAMANNPAVAHAVARARILHLRALLIERRIDPTPRMIALAWNAGIAGAILRTFQPQAVRDYSERVAALYNGPIFPSASGLCGGVPPRSQMR